jgi:phosphoserine phosphatase
MSAPQNIVAVIFDFDDTLTDDSTTKLLERYNIDPQDFWGNRMKQLTDAGWDPTLAYLKLILDNVGDGKPFGNLTNKDLQNFGAALDFYQGIPDLFTDLEKLVKQHEISRPSIEFYIISGGLEEVIKGSKIAPHFRGIWGSRFHEEGGRVRHIMNSLTFTEKTKHIFAINKGVDKDIRSTPYVVNKKIEHPDRRIPIDNMIYLGDGLTDVPCFSVMEQFHGTAFGVFDPKKKGAPKKAWEQLVAPKRVVSTNSPHYKEDEDLGSLLRAAVTQICLRIDTRTRSPLG